MAESKACIELIAYIVVAALLLAAGYFFIEHATRQSECARIIAAILAYAALYVLAKWGYPR